MSPLAPRTWAELEAMAAERAAETGTPCVVFTWPGSRAMYLLDVGVVDGGYDVRLVAALPLESPSPGRRPDHGSAA